MARLLKFDGQDGYPIYVNPDHVISVGSAKNGPNGPVAVGCAALMIGPVAIIVKGSVDYVARQVDEFKRDPVTLGFESVAAIKRI